jgi:hypothetical protein
MSTWREEMTEAQELLGHGVVSQEDRRKAESIVDAVAGDIVQEAPRRVKKKARARPRR